MGVLYIDYVDIYGEYGCEVEFGKVFKLKLSICDEIKIIIKCGIKFVFVSLGL